MRNKAERAFNFIKKSTEIHKNKYDYSNTVYFNFKTKVCIICPEHGEFWQTPQEHLRGQGCRVCGVDLRTKSFSSFKLKKKFEGLIQPEDYKLIPLTKGKLAKVDNEDFDKLKDINWCISQKYSLNKFFGLMHRYIMNAPRDMVVDHINGDTLDNRKTNLRICTHKENVRNSTKSKTPFNKLKGVTKSSKNRYRARIVYNRIPYLIGYFDTEEEAGRAYDTKAKELFGEFARLNFE